MAKDKKEIPAQKPRNFVAKNAIQTGAGAHKDKKKAQKQGDVKHKNRSYDESREFTDLDWAIMEGGGSLDTSLPLRKQRANESYETYLASVLKEALRRQ